MEIHYTYKAEDDLKSLPMAVQKRIAAKMRFYISQKDPLYFAERLTHPAESQYRFRIGDHRVFFDVVKNTIFVLKIAHRKDAYE